jgi:hypothetical protein
MNKKAVLKKIEIKDIDLENEYFSTSYGRDKESLKNSIKEVGLLSLPILKEEKKSLIVITGRLRIAILKELGEKRIDTLVYSKIKVINAFKISIMDNLYRGLNQIEKAIILDKLKNIFKIEEKIIIDTYLPMLNLPKNRKLLEDYLIISRIDPLLKELIIKGDLNYKNAIKINSFSRKEREDILYLIKKLNLNTNKQRELLNLLEEISKRDKKRVSEIISDLKLNIVINNSSLNLEEKFKRIRYLLKKLRYPLWSKDEEVIKSLMKELKITPKIKLSFTPFFEKNEIKVEFNFKNTQELKNLSKDLFEISSKEKLQKIVDLINKD